jgi:hypothetical protein
MLVIFVNNYLMLDFKPHIIPVYPPSNFFIFEEWFAENYKGCNTDRELLPIFPTSFHVNNGYGEKKQELQAYCDSLDPSKKYFILCQYDDGCMVDWKGKDVLEFNMSKQDGVMIPLICQPHPYKFISEKKWFANFVGGRTHKIRIGAEQLKYNLDYYISFEPHDIEKYCRILHESIFTLCYRGYGASSFRICEALQYGSIPVYISDEFIIPFGIDFNDFGILIPLEDQYRVDEVLKSVPIEDLIKKQAVGREVYEKHYTYEGCYSSIINCLEKENAPKT